MELNYMMCSDRLPEEYVPKLCWAEIPIPDCIDPNLFKCPRKE